MVRLSLSTVPMQLVRDFPNIGVGRTILTFIVLSPANCAGKRYALMVIRLVVAETIWRYNLELPPDEDPTRVQKETKNVLVVRPGTLNLIMTRRAE